MAFSSQVRWAMGMIRKQVPRGFFMGALLALVATALTPTSAVAADLPPCSCVWDGTTKDYPANGKTTSWGKTTVAYECGYLCAGDRGVPMRVRGGHQASFRTEQGNEVVCDGLAYPAHANPTGSNGRWTVYMWDGVFHLFDARRSKSPELRRWAQANCAAETPAVPARSLGAKTIDDLRESVGATRMTPRPDPRRKFVVPGLEPEFRNLCLWTDAQSALLEGRDEVELENCEPGRNEGAGQDWREFMARVRKPPTQVPAADLIGELQNLLLCPYTVSGPSPAELRIAQEALLVRVKKDELSAFAWVDASCTMALRGLRWRTQSSAAREALSLFSKKPGN